MLAIDSQLRLPGSAGRLLKQAVILSKWRRYSVMLA